MELTQDVKLRILREIDKHTSVDESGKKVVRRVFRYEIDSLCDLRYLSAWLRELQDAGLIKDVDLAQGLSTPRIDPSDGIQVFVRQDMSLGVLTEAGQRLLDTLERQAREGLSQDSEA